MVASSPRSSGTCGVQPPSSFCASAMSGLRRTGSSLGKGACTIPAREPTMSRTRVASSAEQAFWLVGGGGVDLEEFFLRPARDWFAWLPNLSFGRGLTFHLAEA